jgi:hypothetical protein
MPDAMALPCPRCGAKIGEWCTGAPYSQAICHARDHAWQEAGRPSLTIDWRKALAWYMLHVWHCEGITYVRQGEGGMKCMPPEFKAAIQEVEREWEAMCVENGHVKPDGSRY